MYSNNPAIIYMPILIEPAILLISYIGIVALGRKMPSLKLYAAIISILVAIFPLSIVLIVAFNPIIIDYQRGEWALSIILLIGNIFACIILLVLLACHGIWAIISKNFRANHK